MAVSGMTEVFEQAIAKEREALLSHPVYRALRGPRDVRVFLEHHVWAVWDFMSLLKALQGRLTCVRVPWVPAPQHFAARLVNEIVLAEETDEDGQGGFTSHFELYLRAMIEAGADVGPIQRFVGRISLGVPWRKALLEAGQEIPPAASEFVAFHLGLADSGSLPALVGAFYLGREGLVPEMFNRLLVELGKEFPSCFGKFSYYLHRHIGLDGDEHSPAAGKLLDLVTLGQEEATSEAIQAARQSLRLRHALYDSVHRSLFSG